MSNPGKQRSLVRQFAELREQNERERTRQMIPRELRTKKAMREIRQTLRRIERSKSRFIQGLTKRDE